MRNAVITAVVVGLALSQAGCHLLQRQRRPSRAERATAQMAAKSRRPLLRIGVVTLVNETDQFVLIDSGSMGPPVIGAKLRSYSRNEPSSELKASEVRRRPFVVADIVSGSPRVGDEVFQSGDRGSLPESSP